MRRYQGWIVSYPGIILACKGEGMDLILTEWDIIETMVVVEYWITQGDNVIKLLDEVKQ